MYGFLNTFYGSWEILGMITIWWEKFGKNGQEFELKCFFNWRSGNYLDQKFDICSVEMHRGCCNYSLIDFWFHRIGRCLGIGPVVQQSPRNLHQRTGFSFTSGKSNLFFLTVTNSLHFTKPSLLYWITAQTFLPFSGGVSLLAHFSFPEINHRVVKQDGEMESFPYHTSVYTLFLTFLAAAHHRVCIMGWRRKKVE